MHVRATTSASSASRSVMRTRTSANAPAIVVSGASTRARTTGSRMTSDSKSSAAERPAARAYAT
ncbi:Uncharacterised protein [Mycobacteroides abscessus]|nr:Uncharacterised protein [Mycobacteroides abscessus]